MAGVLVTVVFDTVTPSSRIFVTMFVGLQEGPKDGGRVAAGGAEAGVPVVAHQQIAGFVSQFLVPADLSLECLKL